MRVNFRWIALALFVTAAVAANGCSKTIKYIPVNPCEVDKINCGDNPSVKCDNRDETCKCGPVENGLVCGDKQVCTPQGANQYTCVSAQCELVSCDRGMSCNPTTGECGCGEGESAKKCSDAQTCQNGHCTPDVCDTVTCKFGEACDPTDGTCKCGGTGGVACTGAQGCVNGVCMDVMPCADNSPYNPHCGSSGTCDPADGTCKCGNAAACADGQYCKGQTVPTDGTCMPDPCYGVNCPFLTKCSTDDSQCHCIGNDPSHPAVGPVCSAGQACTDDNGKGGKCLEVNPCANVNCPSGTVCDPSPDPNIGGVCRCGGIGLEYPKCGSDQSCDLAKQACVGGHPCQGVKCDLTFPGTSCDEEDGFCKCGGMGGTRCQVGDVCLPVSGALTCVAKCDPLADACSGEDACYFDPIKNLAACLPQGSTAIGATCKDPTDCVAHSTCATQSGDKKSCVAYCDRTKNGSDCQGQALCIGLDQTPGSNLGQCYHF